jgi:hypothetical protein
VSTWNRYLQEESKNPFDTTGEALNVPKPVDLVGSIEPSGRRKYVIPLHPSETVGDPGRVENPSPNPYRIDPQSERFAALVLDGELKNSAGSGVGLVSFPVLRSAEKVVRLRDVELPT